MPATVWLHPLLRMAQGWNQGVCQAGFSYRGSGENPSPVPPYYRQDSVPRGLGTQFPTYVLAGCQLEAILSSHRSPTFPALHSVASSPQFLLRLPPLT